MCWLLQDSLLQAGYPTLGTPAAPVTVTASCEGKRRRKRKQRAHKPHRRLRGYQGGQHAAAGRARSTEGDSDVIPGEWQTIRSLLNHLCHLRRLILQDREAFQLPVLTVGQLGEERDAKKTVSAMGALGRAGRSSGANMRLLHPGGAAFFGPVTSP